MSVFVWAQKYLSCLSFRHTRTFPNNKNNQLVLVYDHLLKIIWLALHIFFFILQKFQFSKIGFIQQSVALSMHIIFFSFNEPSHLIKLNSLVHTLSHPFCHIFLHFTSPLIVSIYMLFAWSYSSLWITAPFSVDHALIRVARSF